MQPGTRLGHYTISAQIGAGGLGVVGQDDEQKLDAVERCEQLLQDVERVVGPVVQIARIGCAVLILEVDISIRSLDRPQQCIESPKLA